MRADADGEGVWSWSPDAGIKSCETFAGRRRLTSPVLRGERAISRKPSCRECRSDFGVPVVNIACVSFYSARKAVGAAGTGIPCALFFRGTRMTHHSDANRAAGMLKAV